MPEFYRPTKAETARFNAALNALPLDIDADDVRDLLAEHFPGKAVKVHVPSVGDGWITQYPGRSGSDYDVDDEPDPDDGEPESEPQPNDGRPAAAKTTEDEPVTEPEAAKTSEPPKLPAAVLARLKRIAQVEERDPGYAALMAPNAGVRPPQRGPSMGTTGRMTPDGKIEVRGFDGGVIASFAGPAKKETALAQGAQVEAQRRLQAPRPEPVPAGARESFVAAVAAEEAKQGRGLTYQEVSALAQKSGLGNLANYERQ